MCPNLKKNLNPWLWAWIWLSKSHQQEDGIGWHETQGTDTNVHVCASYPLVLTFPSCLALHSVSWTDIAHPNGEKNIFLLHNTLQVVFFYPDTNWHLHKFSTNSSSSFFSKCCFSLCITAVQLLNKITISTDRNRRFNLFKIFMRTRTITKLISSEELHKTFILYWIKDLFMQSCFLHEPRSHWLMSYPEHSNWL